MALRVKMAQQLFHSVTSRGKRRVEPIAFFVHFPSSFQHSFCFLVCVREGFEGALVRELSLAAL